MTFLKTLFWVIVAVIVALLWQSSPRVDLPVGSEEAGGLIINSRLGTWIIIAFVLGFIPLYLYHRTVKWRLKRRIKTLENQAAAQSRAKAEAKTARIEAEQARAEATGAEDQADHDAADSGHETAVETAPRPAPEPDKQA